MRIVSFTAGDNARFGVVDANLSKAVDATDEFGSLRKTLREGRLAELERWVAGREPDVDLDNVNFNIPVPDAANIICIGVNFKKVHPVHGVTPPPENISMFNKMHGSVVGHGSELIKTPLSNTYDYEGEITLVVGKEARNVAPEDVEDVIAGVTILNDGSVREWQAHSVAAGKNFRSSSSIGPWMATLDELPSGLADIHLRTWLNDTLVQDMTAREMIFDIPALVSYVSGFVTLQPGDILSTGSPERTPVPGRESPYLQAGDRVDIEIDGVGRLSNAVVSDSR